MSGRGLRGSIWYVSFVNYMDLFLLKQLRYFMLVQEQLVGLSMMPFSCTIVCRQPGSLNVYVQSRATANVVNHSDKCVHKCLTGTALRETEKCQCQSAMCDDSSS